MKPLAPERHLLRAKDLMDARYAEPLDVATIARADAPSRAAYSWGTSPAKTRC